MALGVVSTAPREEDFMSVQEHQESTPGTFFGGKPVLHYHSINTDIKVSRAEYDQFTILQSLCDIPASQNGLNGHGEGSAAAEPPADVVINGVDVWVNSQNVLLYSPTKNTGIQIPYPNIAIHALSPLQPRHVINHTPILTQNADNTINQQIAVSIGPNENLTQAVYIQLNLHDANLTNSDEEVETLDLNIFPRMVSHAIQAGSPGQLLYAALSACADLWPDAEEQAGGGEGEEDTTPGAGGWITSENMGDFVDEDGNFIGTDSAGGLGAGAGRVHARDDEDEEEEEEVTGSGNGDAETKWQRTD
ncbi:hypothetical protein EJ08DRAFT_701738 [Tothia fuscella]|uniref:Uncharacterized protein n=1 Tax=Tothia fuscella TaxID=1048955 RepID=A0A9P4NHY2_9PEZI|nr:hypothetical protein EJ08DRAFT_701738 [Tothia fuscella]